MQQDNNRALAVSPQQALSPTEARRYQKLKRQIGDWWEDRFKIGEVLREIQDARLYRQEYSSFEAFCESEYGIKRSYAYRLIEAAGVKASVAMSPIGDKLVHESQARALGSVPAENRVAVLTQAAETGSVTAKGIAEVAQGANGHAPAQAKETPVINLDKTGYPIPESILEDWNRAEAFGLTLREISRIKSMVEDGLKERDFVLFAEVTNRTVATLKNAYGDLTQVIPHAVCSSCQGHERKKCALCKGRGFLSRFKYETCVSQKARDIREKAVHK